MVALGIFGALTKLKSAANDLPYTIQVALGLFGQCNAQASKVAHCISAKGQFLTLGTLVSYCFRFFNKPVEMLLVITNIGTKCGRLKGSKCSDVVLCHPSEMLFYFICVFTGEQSE